MEKRAAKRVSNDGSDAGRCKITVIVPACMVLDNRAENLIGAKHANVACHTWLTQRPVLEEIHDAQQHARTLPGHQEASWFVGRSPSSTTAPGKRPQRT
jgi:hypothetical protein